MSKPLELLWAEDSCISKGCMGQVYRTFLINNQKIFRVCSVHCPPNPPTDYQELSPADLQKLRGNISFPNGSGSSTFVELAVAAGYMLNGSTREKNAFLYACTKANQTAFFLQVNPHSYQSAYDIKWCKSESAVTETRHHIKFLYYELQAKWSDQGSAHMITSDWNWHPGDPTACISQVTYDQAIYLLSDLIRLEQAVRDPAWLACSLVLQT